MMKDIDGISRYIDHFVHQYLITTSRSYTVDVTYCPFAYVVDVFCRCINPRRVTASDPFSVSLTTSLIGSIVVLYHKPIIFSIVFNSSSILPVYLPNPDLPVLSFPVASLSGIT